MNRTAEVWRDIEIWWKKRLGALGLYKALLQEDMHQIWGQHYPDLIAWVTDKHRHKHDKANILADNWESMFNGAADAKEEIEDYVAKHRRNWTHDRDQ